MSKGPPRFLLLKAQPIPAGARWITVTPPGHEKGQPVLVQPHPTHKGVWSVIGGAGGKLNYLKLRGIKPEGSYKSDLAEKDKARRELAKQQAARDKELGIAKPKAVRKAEIAAQRQQHQREFIATVAAAAGWRKEQTEFKAEDHAHLSPEAYQAVQRQHHASLLKKAKAFVAQQRAELLADADKKAEAFGAVPLTAPKDRPEALTVNDLDPVKAPDAGIGLSHDYAERAVEKAGGADDLKAEVDALREPKAGGGGDKRREMAEQIKRELAELKIPDTPLPDPKSLDTRQTLGLLAAEKRLRQAERAMSKAMAAIDKAEDIKEIQAYNVEVGEPPDDASVIRDLQDIARTEQTVSFLKMAEEAGEGIPPEQALYRHIAAGASNALSAAGLTIAGQALVDRSVVDVLGIAGAAQVAARQLHATLTPDELETVKSALDDYHVDHYSRTAREAMDRAQVWLEAADKAQGMDATAEDGDDLAIIQNLNRQRIEALAEARKILGTALGEFEMGAALNMAMREGRSNKPFEVSLGKINPASAYTQLRALGLEPGDFQVSAIGGEQIAEITPDGLDKISRPIDREALQRQRAALDIIEGRQDEKDWLPEGFAARKDLNGIAEPGQAPKLAEPFDAGKGLEQGIKDYFGGRIADGDNPRDILADATNSQWMDTHVQAGGREAYLSALAALLPSTRTRKAMAEGTGGEGKLVTEKVPIENHRDILEAWADEFVKSRYGETRTAFDRQDIPIDDISTEAMHRALAAHPEGVAAFKTIGDLTDKDQRALRTYFEKHVAKDSDEAAALKKEIAELKDAEPEKETVDMFGDTATNPQWTAWSQKLAAKREKLGAESLTWDKYVTVMDGREHAYAAVQDLIRSKVTETFHATYNTLRPDAPLKLGRQNLRDHRRHLDAIDPKARKERLTAQSSEDAAMRFRRGGKFAEGGIKDEREEQRTAKEGFQQAQIGMFGEPEDTAPVPLGAHERHSLGHVTEQRLAGLANTIGGQFKTGQPVELRAVSMTDRYINQQRAIKLIAANKRVALAMSTGSGKTSIGLGAFAHLHAKGEVKRGIFAVPSVVQEQFNAEALRTLDPSKGYKWHATPGANREARIAALKDPGNHFVVMTHQSLRDDLLHLGAQHEGIDTTALAAKLDAMTPAERKAWMGDLLKREGINADYCLPYNASITLADGSNIMIGDIVENRIKADVMCFNLENGKIESKPIIGWQKIEQNSDQLITVYAGTKSVTCTEDHKIWTANRGYVKAADIKPGDELVAIPSGLSKIIHGDEIATRSTGHADKRYDSRIAARGFLHNIIWRRNSKIKNEAFSPSERIPHAQIRNFEKHLSIPAKIREKWRFWHGAMGFFDQLHDMASRIVRGLLSGRGKAAYRSHSEIYKPNCNGLLVHGRRQPVEKHGNDKHSRVFDGAAAFFSRFNQREIWVGNHGSNRQAKKLVLHENEKKRISEIFQSNWRVCAGLHEVQANQYFPEILPAVFRADTRKVMRYMWDKLYEGIYLFISVMPIADNKKKESRLVSKKQGIHIETKNGRTLGAAWEPILRNLRGIISGKNNKPRHLLNRVQQGEKAQVCVESLLPEKIIVTSTSIARSPRYVYDLTVADNHNFFACGILVSNCFFDESHVLLNREGKENSAMANVLDSLSNNASYYVNSTADPVKNSVDEAFDLMRKMNPDKYADRDEFMRRYGPNTAAAKDALKREMLQHLYPGRIDPGVAAKRTQEKVDLSDEQKATIGGIESAAAKVRLARMRGKADIESARKLAPEMFDGADPKEHERIAREIARYVGVLKNTAILKAINTGPNSAKLDRVAQLAKARKGKPGVVFAHNLESVKRLKERLEKDGHRVAVLTGADGAKKKGQIKSAFSPEGDVDATADILITSDAGATGLNAQRGQWLVQYDVPDTAMTHAQRNGRIHRLGQKNNVELIDLMTDHKTEQAARKRLAEKYELREILTSPYEGLDDTGLASFLHRRKVNDEEQQGGLF